MREGRGDAENRGRKAEREREIGGLTFTFFSRLEQQKRQFSSKDQSETSVGSQSETHKHTHTHMHTPTLVQFEVALTIKPNLFSLTISP